LLPVVVAVGVVAVGVVGVAAVVVVAVVDSLFSSTREHFFCLDFFFRK